VTDCQSEPTPNTDTPIPPKEITIDEEFGVYNAYDTGRPKHLHNNTEPKLSLGSVLGLKLK